MHFRASNSNCSNSFIAFKIAMASFTSTASVRPCAVKAFTGQRVIIGSLLSTKQERRALSQKRPQSLEGQSMALHKSSSRRPVQTHAAQELYQLADVGTFVTGTAATIFAMTLVGLAIGFVLLRFEALVEEGKI